MAQSSLMVISQPRVWLTAPAPFFQANARWTSNGTRSRITWSQARASLCATALIATTGIVLAHWR